MLIYFIRLNAEFTSTKIYKIYSIANAPTPTAYITKGLEKVINTNEMNEAVIIAEIILNKTNSNSNSKMLRAKAQLRNSEID
jgi:hypothetical protein